MSKFNTIIKYYVHLARLALLILRVHGVKGLLFAFDRYFRKIKGERLQDYPRAQDYTKGLVTVAILSKNRLDLIQPCLEAIYKYPSRKYKFEVMIGDTGTTEMEVLRFYRRAIQQHRNLTLIRFNHYNFSKNYNRLIRDHAEGQYVILLNNDTLVTDGWLDNLVDPLADTQIGIVGAKLLFPDDTIQHAGIEFNEAGNGVHVYAHEPRDLPDANYPAEVPAVTFAAVALRHDVFDRFQLSQDFKEEAQDSDFCFRLTAAGFKVLYNPAAAIYHLESMSRGGEPGNRARPWLRREWAPRIDRLRLRQKWDSRLQGLLAQESQRTRFDPQEYGDAITVMRDDGIGDLLMGVCAFKKLRARYPQKKLMLATYERNIPMMAGFKIFDEFIPIPNGHKLSPLPVPRASQVFDFISMEMEFGPIWGITSEDNKINRHLVYTRDLGLDQTFELAPMPEYPEARERVRRLLQEMGIDLTRRFVVLSLIASNPARSWWEPYYPQLIEAIQAMGFTPLVLGTLNSKYFNGRGIINLIGKTAGITDFIEAIKLASYVISTDSSAYHIAAMSRIPFLAIFTGGVKPEARLNFYTDYEVIEPPPELPCYPCWDEGCKDLTVRWKSDPCRLSISPAAVIDKFKRLVARYPSPTQNRQ